MATRLRIEAERPAPRQVQPGVQALKRNGVIIYPTDTGYAFGCAMSSSRGVTKLRKLKGLDDHSHKPLTMLVHDLGEIGRYGYVGNRVFRMVKRMLPGPYTLVLKATKEVPRAVRNRDGEIGLRIPDHRVCDLLMRDLGEPLLTSSLTGTDQESELEDPDDFYNGYDVDAVLDVGPLWPDPSTVLRLVDDEVEVLREGQGPLP